MFFTPVSNVANDVQLARIIIYEMLKSLFCEYCLYAGVFFTVNPAIV